jgi:hypothetical protein
MAQFMIAPVKPTIEEEDERKRLKKKSKEKMSNGKKLNSEDNLRLQELVKQNKAYKTELKEYEQHQEAMNMEKKNNSVTQHNMWSIISFI